VVQKRPRRFTSLLEQDFNFRRCCQLSVGSFLHQASTAENPNPINKDTPVIILCGGQGTRIANLSGSTTPKPMVRIGEKPVLWHIMKIYASQAYTNFILALGHSGGSSTTTS
jgi:hypothetical protein